MIQVFKKIAGASASIGQGRREIPLQQNDSNLRNAYEGYGILQSKKILFAVDGFLASLRAKLYKYFIHLWFQVKIYMVHVMEWSDEEDESVE